MYNSVNNFEGLVRELLDIINLVIPLVFALALVVVIWKVAQAWIIGGGDPKNVEAGKNTVIVAVIALTVMASVWGIVNILKSSLF